MKNKKKTFFKSLTGATFGASLGFSLTQFIYSGCTDLPYLILTVFAVLGLVFNILSEACKD